eukprot:365745-Chlamydomonas_euryale.AAC.1
MMRRRLSNFVPAGGKRVLCATTGDTHTIWCECHWPLWACQQHKAGQLASSAPHSGAPIPAFQTRLLPFATYLPRPDFPHPTFNQPSTYLSPTYLQPTFNLPSLILPFPHPTFNQPSTCLPSPCLLASATLFKVRGGAAGGRDRGPGARRRRRAGVW